MNRGEKKRFTPPVVGGSSLLVIFAILCLTIFSLLSLSTVEADLRLDEAALSAVSGYYEADLEAEKILARLRAGDVPDGVTVRRDGDLSGVAPAALNTEAVTAEYACTISDTQELRVRIRFEHGLGGEYSIERWQAVSTAEWQPEGGAGVWDGDFGEIID